MDSDDDVCFVKVTSVKTQKKKASSWVTSSFDDLGCFEPPSSSTSSSSSKSAKARSSSHSSSSHSSSSHSSSSHSSSSHSFSSHSSSSQSQGNSRMVQKTLSRSFAQDKSAALTSRPESRKRQRELSLPAHKLLSAVKSSHHGKHRKPATNFDLWSEKHHPKKKEDLAVHKKKVEDICCWLRDRTKRFPQHAAPILLLTGPPGSGKTATIRTLAAELNLTVQEWINPAAASGGDFRPADQLDWSERSSVDVFSSQSQSSQFSHFLLRANKYRALQMGAEASPGSQGCGGRLILVEDIPNAFYRDPSELHNIVRKYRRCGHCPLVFVVSDASNSSSNVQKLFPPGLQGELGVETISVNPVAPTMMVKVLNKIANLEAAQGSFAVPSARVVEPIAMSSAGDVRSAINALQFACRQDTVDLSRLRMVQKSLKKESSGSGRRLKYGGLAKQDSGSAGSSETGAVIGAKDTTCFLFHALGKILYFKRGDPADSPQHPSLPAHLSHHDRDPLLLTPEEVVEKTHLSGDYFNTFLHQNYVDFVQSVEDLERASEYLSDADMLSAQYTSRGQLQDYSISVATRGLIHCQSSLSRHTHSRKGHGWRPMHKSQWFASQRQSQESKSTAMQLFRGYHWEPEVLLTELVPYINLINPTLHDPGQFAFVQNLCQFSRSAYVLRSGLEKIEEKAAMDDDDDEKEEEDASQRPLPSSSSSVRGQTQVNPPTSSSSSLQKPEDLGEDEDLPSSQSTVNMAPVEVEEEFVIEEFED